MKNFPIATVAAVNAYFADPTVKIDVPSQLVQALSEGNLRLIDGEIIHTAEIPNGGIKGDKVALLTVKNDQINGKSDFDGKKLDPNKIAIADALSFGYAEAATDEGAAVKYTNLMSQVPADLLSCRLVVEQKGRIVVERYVRDLCVNDLQGGAGGGTSEFGYTQSKEDQYTNLREFAVAVGDRETEIYLVTPDDETVAPSATNGHIRFGMHGLVTVTSL